MPGTRLGRWNFGAPNLGRTNRERASGEWLAAPPAKCTACQIQYSAACAMAKALIDTDEAVIWQRIPHRQRWRRAETGGG